MYWYEFDFLCFEALKHCYVACFEMLLKYCLMYKYLSLSWVLWRYRRLTLMLVFSGTGTLACKQALQLWWAKWAVRNMWARIKAVRGGGGPLVFLSPFTSFSHLTSHDSLKMESLLAGYWNPRQVMSPMHCHFSLAWEQALKRAMWNADWQRWH